MYWEDMKQQFRQSGSTFDKDVEAIKLMSLDNEPEIVVLVLHYPSERNSKPWAFRLKREDLSKLVHQLLMKIGEGDRS